MERLIPRRKSSRAAIGAAALAVLLSSCSGNVPVYPVRGKILMGDKPAEGATLTFNPVEASTEAKKWVTQGAVTATGDIVLRTYRLPLSDYPRMGAPAGEYVVTVVWTVRPDGTVVTPPLDDDFADPQKSPLRVTIKPGVNNLESLQLSSKKAVTPQ
jgi:hypothetical protein